MAKGRVIISCAIHPLMSPYLPVTALEALGLEVATPSAARTIPDLKNGDRAEI